MTQALKGEEALHTALLRNVYGNEEGSKATAATLERYVLRCVGRGCWRASRMHTGSCSAWQ